jgi:predicted methyltransferase
MRKILALCTLALFTVCAGATKPEDSQEGRSIASAINAASAGEHRSADNIARNPSRHPAGTLVFFGLTPNMTVLEIHPGGLWYTEILAPVLKEDGQLIVAGHDTSIENQPGYRYRQQASMEQRFSEEATIFGEVDIVKLTPPDSIALGAPASVDMVLTFRNFHGWIRDGVASVNMQAFYQVLKPGGVLGVVQHRTDTPGLLPSGKINGYVSETQMVELAEAAGFVLEARSEINANPKDNHQHPAGVWSLPPTLRLGEENRQTYLDIGESDRMTLRFRKPRS